MPLNPKNSPRAKPASKGRAPGGTSGETNSPGTSGKTDWAALALDAVRAGNNEAAVDLFVNAIAHDKRNAGLRYNLALVLERIGDADDAAVAYTEALRLKPRFPEAASRLALLMERYVIDDHGRLDPAGLKAALTSDGVDRQALGQAAIALLVAASPLGHVIADGEVHGWDIVAEHLLVPRVAPILRDGLFLLALREHINQSIPLEYLLTALRHAIILLPADRFTERELVTFTLALVQQLHNAERVGIATADERAMIEALGAAETNPYQMGEDQPRRTLARLLYEPFEAIFGEDTDAKKLNALRPKSLRDDAVAHLKASAEERRRTHAMPRINSGSDATSDAVAAQYEANPYPRWISMQTPPEGRYQRMLERFVPASRLAFMEKPFDVLIAGCGTGRHAIRSAIGYGSNASVTALDLSRRSLAFAARKASAMDVKDMEFIQGDLLDVVRLGRSFHVIESIGVLHHMADPFDGLKALTRCLRPGGLIQIGVYSAVAREELASLRTDPDYPGAACDDDALRAYRQTLMRRGPHEIGGELSVSIDFWSMSSFRDLVLHVSERQLTLPDFAGRLDEFGLTFRGFTLPAPVSDEFFTAHPDETWPGSLDTWWTWEQENPRLFDAMYVFWAEKAQA